MSAKRKFDDEGLYSTSAGADEAARAAIALAKQYASQAREAGPPVNLRTDIREQNDPAFIKDIEINHLRNRYVLTRASSQAKILEETGATVTTKGVWYPDISSATEKDPPLYLHIGADSQEVLNKGIAAVEALMAQELGPLINDYKTNPQKRRWPEERILIGLESLRNFNIRAKVVGPAGLFVKHIQAETGARVQVRGIGSGFIEQETGREHDEPLQVVVSCADELMLAKAKELAEDLLVVVREEHAKTIAFNQSYLSQAQPHYASYYQQPQYPQYGQQPYPGQQLPMPGQPAPPPPPGGMAPPPLVSCFQKVPYQKYSPPGGDFASQLPPGMANTPEQVAYWQQLASNPQYAEYYQQCLAYYQAQAAQANPGYAQPPPPSQQPPPPPDHRREGRGQYGAVAPPSY